MQERPRRPVALDSLRGDREFRKVRQQGVALRDPLFTLRLTDYRPRYGETWQPRAIIGVVISKKTLKRAVDRNRARRRVREALRTLEGGLPPCRAILLPNPGVLTVPFPALQAALIRVLAKAPGRVKKGSGSKQAGNSGRSQPVSEAVKSPPVHPLTAPSQIVPSQIVPSQTAQPQAGQALGEPSA